MSQSKKIYFLSALVLIIGCYALNLSYSLFVQTEENEVLNSEVVGLSYSLNQSTFAIDSNSTKIVKLVVTNTSSTEMNFGLIASSKNYGYKVSVLEDYSSYGILSSNQSKEIYLAIENKNDFCIEVNFTLEYNYTTINFNEDSYLAISNIDNENKYNYSFPIVLKDIIINNAQDNIDSSRSTLVEEFLTTPGKSINDLEEKSLVKLMVSDGTSYYYRGNVEDNYLTYNNSCYRIVGIDNNSNIKLIYYANKPCDEEINKNSGYATINDQYIETIYDSVSTSELNKDLRYEKSLLKNTLENWFEYQNFNKEELIMADWCNDLSNNNGIYNSYNRLVNENIGLPTLECNNIIKSYVGTLTADEIVFAGNIFDNKNINNYLYKNAEDYSWWTLTPYSLSKDNYNNSEMFIFNGKLDKNVLSTLNRIRPSIVLKGTLLVKGNGTKESPYIIDNNITSLGVCEKS